MRGRLAKNEFQRMWKRAHGQFEAVFPHFPGGTDRNHENHHSRKAVSMLTLDPNFVYTTPIVLWSPRTSFKIEDV
jgi:hypothetical protein